MRSRLVLKQRLDYLSSIYQEKDLRRILAKFGLFVSSTLYQHADYLVYANSLKNQSYTINPKFQFLIDQLTEREKIATLHSIAGSVDISRFYWMFDHGSNTFTASQNDLIVGYAWVSQKIDDQVNRVQPQLHPGDACLHDLLVSPVYRGQGIGLALVAMCTQFIRDNGCRQALSVILINNTTSQRVFQKAGYFQIGKLSHSRILFWDRLKIMYQTKGP